MSPPKKTPWHEKSHIRMVIWLMLVVTACGAFYMFNDLATKNMAARGKIQAPPPSSAPAPAATATTAAH